MNKIRMEAVQTEEEIKTLAGLAHSIWHEYFPAILTEEQDRLYGRTVPVCFSYDPADSGAGIPVLFSGGRGSAGWVLRDMPGWEQIVFEQAVSEKGAPGQGLRQSGVRIFGGVLRKKWL